MTGSRPTRTAPPRSPAGRGTGARPGPHSGPRPGPRTGSPLARLGGPGALTRGLLPLLVVPLALLASVLATAPWLRSFPTSVAGAPLYGAAVLSVLVPLLTSGLRPRAVWVSALVDLVAFVVYALLVVLHDPLGVPSLAQGLYQGPSQILTFALPLVSPRRLMAAPVALTWLAGALAGECLARRWYTLLPYGGFLLAFGLAVAGSQRGAGPDAASAHLTETVLATGLLVTLLLMRSVQAWVHQDETAESTQPDGILPMRSVAVGAALTAVIALVASLAVQTGAFPKQADTPQRAPTVNESTPLSPLAYVAGLRPRTVGAPSPTLFNVNLDATSPGYVALADLDTYDGSGWTFDRTFRPSGGVVPDDTDTSLQTRYGVTQAYRIIGGRITGVPWMPFVYRPQRVVGIGVNIDPQSGMIVPARRLRVGDTYTVRSATNARTFAQLKLGAAEPDTTTPTVDTQLPGTVRVTLGQLISAFVDETGVPSSPALPFLSAMQRDLRAHYELSNAAQGSASSVRSSSPTPSGAPGPATSGPAAELAGGPGFADVLASILGPNRNGTPEQFATLIALVARQLGVPARVVTGFRIPRTGDAPQVPAGSYDVTGADAWTWTEVPLVGQGWVVLDASPTQYAATNQQTESAGAAPSSSAAPPSQNALATQSSSEGNAIGARSSTGGHGASRGAGLLLAIAVLAGVLLVLGLIVFLSRKRRRAARRRRARDPRLRLIGAWQESIDLLAEAGLPDLGTLTSTEIAAVTRQRFGEAPGDEAAALGTAANAVAYSSATPVDDSAADAAWSRHRSLRTEVRRRLGVRGRLAAGLRYNRPGPSVPASPRSWADEAARQEASEGAPGRTARRRRRRYEGRRRAH